MNRLITWAAAHKIAATLVGVSLVGGALVGATATFASRHRTQAFPPAPPRLATTPAPVPTAPQATPEPTTPEPVVDAVGPDDEVQLEFSDGDIEATLATSVDEEVPLLEGFKVNHGTLVIVPMSLTSLDTTTKVPMASFRVRTADGRLWRWSRSAQKLADKWADVEVKGARGNEYVPVDDGGWSVGVPVVVTGKVKAVQIVTEDGGGAEWDIRRVRVRPGPGAVLGRVSGRGSGLYRVPRFSEEQVPAQRVCIEMTGRGNNIMWSQMDAAGSGAELLVNVIGPVKECQDGVELDSKLNVIASGPWKVTITAPRDLPL